MNDLNTWASHHPLAQLIALSSGIRSADYSFLIERVYTTTLSPLEIARFTRLIELARQAQYENPSFEPLYQHLMHLFVLNGSRVDLLQRIDRRLRGLVAGYNAFVLISGASGIGKTSLILALHQRIESLGAILLSVRCSEQSSSAFGLWKNLAYQATAAGLVSGSLPAPIGGQGEAFTTHQMYVSLETWLKDCARLKPLVVLLDDLHWADQDSLEALDYLSAQPDLKPVLFVATYRTEETQLEHVFYQFLPRLMRNRVVDLLEPASLTSADIERLLTARVGSPSPGLVDYLYTRAGGNPLFSVILLNDLTAQGLLSCDVQGLWQPPARDVQIPGMLRQLILQRVNPLSPAAVSLLNVAAVIGESWLLGRCEALLDMPETSLLSAVRESLHAGLIEVEDERQELYRFSHGMIRQVLYSNQPIRKRKQIHGLLAELYEKTQPTLVFEIAHHYLESANWPRAAAFCQAASDQASHQFASYSAIQWCQKALDAAECAGENELVYQLYRRLGRLFLALGQRDQSEEVYSQMCALARSKGDLLALSTALLDLAHIRMRRFQMELAESTIAEALAIASQASEPQLMAEINACLGALEIGRGDLANADQHLSAVTMPGGAAEGSDTLIDALRLQAYQSIWQGKYQLAEQSARRAILGASSSGDPLVLVGAYQNLAFAQIESGRYVQAYDTLQSTLAAIAQSGSHHHQEPRLLNLMGYLHLELGDPQAALVWDQKSTAAVLDSHPQNLEMRRYSLLNQATDYLHLGQYAAVDQILTRFAQITEGADFVQFRYHNRHQLLLSEYYLKLKNYPQAIALAQQARSLAQSKGMIKNIAKSHWLEAQAYPNALETALAHFERAIELVDEIEHGSLRWKIRLGMAAALQASGMPILDVLGKVRHQVDETLRGVAGSIFVDMLLRSTWIAELRRLEQKSALPQPAYPAGLSRREVEILRLVAKGASDRQVAEVLHLSIRTVNTHMTHIFNKTGLDNRTAASDFARQHGLLL